MNENNWSDFYKNNKDSWNDLIKKYKDVKYNKYEEFDPVKKRLADIERKLKLIEEFLNKFFDTDIDGKDK